MRLYVLRHAIAEEGAGKPDRERQLTDEGREKLARVLDHARNREVRPVRILTSPYPRALETARLAQTALGVANPLVETEKLVPYASLRELLDELRENADAETLMLVGHNPLLSDLLAGLTGDASLVMKKAALACLELADPHARAPRATLQWMITAKTAQ
jgi:phosphohistidine phosphatase